MSVLGGLVGVLVSLAKLAEHDEMRYTLIAVIFPLIAVAGGNAAGSMPRTRAWAAGEHS